MMPGQPPFPLNGSATYGSNAGIYSGSTAINSSNAGIFAGNSGIYASNADEFGGGEQMFVLFWMCMSLSSVLRTLVKVSQVRPLCTTALSVPGFAVSFIESLFHVLKSRGLVVFSFIEIRGLLVCLLGREHACQPFDPRHGRQNRVCRQHGQLPFISRQTFSYTRASHSLIISRPYAVSDNTSVVSSLNLGG